MKPKLKGESSLKKIKSLTIVVQSFAEYFCEKFSFTEFLTPKNLIAVNSKIAFKFPSSNEELKEFSEKVSDESFEKNETNRLHELPNSSTINIVVEEIKSDKKQALESKVSDAIIKESYKNNNSDSNFSVKNLNEEKTTLVTPTSPSIVIKECHEKFENEKNKCLISLQKFERITKYLDFVESSQNQQGNYQNYVYFSLKSFIQLQNINFGQVLSKKTCYTLPETEQKHKKTLILDLDETLIHANFDHNIKNKGKLLEFTNDKAIYTFELFIRPGLNEFLQKMSEMFELFVFTASKKEYADSVLDYIDPGRKYIKHCFYREDCIGIKDKIFIKDLRIFTNRRLEDIVMLDNSMYSFVNQLSNGVLINSFYDNEQDTELYNVMGYLEKYIANTEDVRVANNQIFGFNEILNDILLV